MQWLLSKYSKNIQSKHKELGRFSPFIVCYMLGISHFWVPVKIPRLSSARSRDVVLAPIKLT